MMSQAPTTGATPTSTSTSTTSSPVVNKTSAPDVDKPGQDVKPTRLKSVVNLGVIHLVDLVPEYSDSSVSKLRDSLVFAPPKEIEGFFWPWQDINARDSTGYTELSRAVQRKEVSKVEELLVKGALVSVACNLGRTPLHYAALGGEVAIIEMLLAKGAPASSADSYKRTPLHYAIIAGDTQAASMLITKGASAQAFDKFGITPLHLAAASGQVSMADGLIFKGANIEAKSDGGWTPLLMAFFFGHLQTCDLLLMRNAEVNIRNDDGLSALMMAAEQNYLDLADKLIIRGAEINLANRRGLTALHVAALRSNVEMATLLLDKGADRTMRDYDGRLAEDIAKKSHNDELKKVFASKKRENESKKLEFESEPPSASEATNMEPIEPAAKIDSEFYEASSGDPIQSSTEASVDSNAGKKIVRRSTVLIKPENPSHRPAMNRLRDFESHQQQMQTYPDEPKLVGTNRAQIDDGHNGNALAATTMASFTVVETASLLDLLVRKLTGEKYAPGGISISKDDYLSERIAEIDGTLNKAINSYSEDSVHSRRGGRQHN